MGDYMTLLHKHKINGGFLAPDNITFEERNKNEMILELQNEVNNQSKEIERLNNIINELEHHLYQEWLEWKDSDCESIYSRAGEDKAIYDYLQELKGSDKE